MPEYGLYKKVFSFQNVMWLILGLQFFALPAFSAEGNKSLILQDAHDPMVRNFSHPSPFPGDGLPQDFFVDSNGNIFQSLPHGQTQIVGKAISTIPAKASSRVKFTGNLDASAPVLVHVTNSSLLADPFHPGISQFSTSFPIFDSLGIRHDMTIVYTKISTNIWQYTGIARASEVSVVAGYSSHFTDQALILQGTIKFNSSGFLDREETAVFFNASGTGIDFTNGAQAGQRLVIDFGTSISTEGGTGADGMLQQGSGSVLHTFSQDGYSPGMLSGIAITEEREIIGRYDNGETKILGQALPTFARHPGSKNYHEDRKQRKGIKETPPLPPSGIPNTMYAVQSGIWTVGQVGSWHVNVDNNSDQPIPVQDVSLRKREPWTYTQPFQFPSENFSAGEILLNVPPAKNLIIQHVSLQSTAWDSLAGIAQPQLIASLHTRFQNLPVTHQFGLADIFRIDSGEHQQVRHVLSKAVSLYADSNSQLRVIVERNYGGRQQDGTLTLTGYLEPYP